MKSFIKSILYLSVPLVFIACSQNTPLAPKASMAINKQVFELNEAMNILFTGIADQVVIYTGDNGHNYEQRNERHTGIADNKNTFNYSFSIPGTYKIVCIASTYNNLAVEILRDTCSCVVTIVDDNTEIEKISCPQILYDEVFAERMPNDEWLMRLPYQVMYNNKPANIPLSQRLKIYVASDSTQVTINGKAFDDRTKYDLSEIVNIDLKSNKGSERLYKLYTIYYPEFESFNIAGVEGMLIRNIFDYSSFEMSITLPEGTDVHNAIPTFTTKNPKDKVYINESEQISGTSIVNFTQTVTYRLVSTIDGQKKQAVSYITIKINYEQQS